MLGILVGTHGELGNGDRIKIHPTTGNEDGAGAETYVGMGNRKHSRTGVIFTYYCRLPTCHPFLNLKVYLVFYCDSHLS